MTRLGYFSPAILGALAAVIYAVFGRGDYSQADRALMAVISAPAVALVCQLLMLSAQGIFAGVLPVPPGRTLRGRACAIVGLLLLAGMVCGVVAYLASRVHTGRLTWVSAGAGALCWLVAIGLYGWSLPTAQRDFAEPPAE